MYSRSLYQKLQILKGLYKNIKTNLDCDEFCNLLLNKTCRIKLGIDPTAPDLHLGHAVVFKRLRILQDLGHEIIIVFGGFTACIGDPSGRTSSRLVLARDIIFSNIADYKSSILKFLQTKTTFVNNDDWFSKLTLTDWISLCQQVTISQLIQRSDIKNRLKQSKPVSLAEITYPVLQGYDSVVLKADIEFGGEDQWFNLMMGRQMQSIYQQDKQAVVACPLLIGLDGERKMSKTFNNQISLDDDRMFSKIMSISDKFFKNFCMNLIFEPHMISQLEQIDKLAGVELMNFKQQIAEYITVQYQSSAAAQKQISSFHNPQAQAVKYNIDEDINILALAQLIWPELSKSHIKRLINQNAVQINQQAVSDPKYVINAKQQSIKLKLGNKYSIIN